MPDFPWKAPLSEEIKALILEYGISDSNRTPIDAEKATPFQNILNEPHEFQNVESYRQFLADYATKYLNSVPGADSDEGNGHVAFLARGVVDGILDDDQLFDLDILLKRRALWGKFVEAMITETVWEKVWGDAKGYPLWQTDLIGLGWKGYSFQRFDAWDAEQFKNQIKEDGQKSALGENLAWNKFQRIRARLLHEGLFASVMVTRSEMAKQDVWAKPIDWLAAAILLAGHLEEHTLGMIEIHARRRRIDIGMGSLILPHILAGYRAARVTGARVVVAQDIVREPDDDKDTSWLTRALMPSLDRRPFAGWSWELPVPDPTPTLDS